MIQVDSSLLISTYQKNLLEQEWEFIKTTCPHIPGGEARASNTFCQMACGILMSIGDFMRMGSDDIVKNMYDVSDDIDEEDNATRKTLYEALRGFQSLFGEARERTFKAISFAKLLRKDLEVAAEFHLAGGFDELMSRLQETEHVQVLAPHSAHHYIFVPKTISGHQEKILQMLDMHCGQANGVITENKGYLVLVDNSLCPEHLAVWEGDTIHVKPTAEAVIALAQIKVSGVLLVAPTASSLEARRKDFLRKMKEVISMSKEQRATSQAIANSLDQVKQEALQLRSQICEELVMVEERCDMSALDQAEKETLARRMREMLHQCYKFGFEYHKELDKLITGENSRQVQAQGVIQFSTQWMRFVLKWCERGKGLKPDWAAKGIEFLCFAADPKVTNFLSDDEFMDFKALSEDCHSHVVGDKETPERRQSVSPNPFERERAGPGRFSRSSSRQASPSRSTSRDETTLFNLKVSSPGTELDRIAMPPPQSPMGTMKRRKSGTRKSLTSVVDDECDVAIKVPAFATLPWPERVKRSIHNFENEREETRREQQVIGQVLDKTQPEDRIHIKARLVRFSWQRGVKIGQGTFGKVYTAINNETGDIMAMKEIPLQPNDHKTLRSVAEELRIFESIHHPNIINHFGVEIHREEMLIFMEYCPEGTLESLVSSTENGLEESIVRRYTRQLVEAVACLHEHGVVHRDIKGANIFLTEEMKTIKLGDFGCAVKIKAHTTMPGELQGFVGTQAYMAPEVFTRNMNEGHGRAADVWSMACVVLEMVQGERPWADLQSNYQIMFKVGMGQSPGVPDHLSEEGKDFLGTCFVQNPQERATAQDLLSHNFIKIFEEDENQSLPLFTSFSDFSEMRRSLVRKDSGKY